MKRWLVLAALAALLACMLAPHPGFTEDRDTVLLARAIYALARDSSYEAKLAIGTVAMNRVESPWHPDTLGGVLTEQHQFPAGRRYDAESLTAAHEVLSGRRVFSEDVVGYAPAGRRAQDPVRTIDGFAFYTGEPGL